LINSNTKQFDDTAFTDQYQKDVYLLARYISRKLSESNSRRLRVFDVGCGSGWKLINYFANEFDIVGIETDSAINFLQKNYPNFNWISSGKK
jgi:hypothetical protein